MNQNLKINQQENDNKKEKYFIKIFYIKQN